MLVRDNITSGTRPKLIFLYLGRSQALGRFTLELAQTAAKASDVDCAFVVSSHNAMSPEFVKHDLNVFQVPTFERSRPWEAFVRYPATRKRILQELSLKRPDAVVTLMPHIWSPLLSPAIRQLGINYTTIVHDAVPHVGDITARVTNWLLRDVNNADRVITLSRAVAERLIGQQRVIPERITPLFHPDILYGSGLAARARNPEQPLRLLFFGRIMAYKGLPLLLDAIEVLRNQGYGIELGVAGSGDLGEFTPRLRAIGAEIDNRWIPDHEVGQILMRYDVMACPHLEASQSGIAATAFGNCMPVIATPVGGLPEQVVNGVTGLLAERVSSLAFAEAVRQLAEAPGLYQRISTSLSETAESRSMKRFLELITEDVMSIAKGHKMVSDKLPILGSTPS